MRPTRSQVMVVLIMLAVGFSVIGPRSAGAPANAASPGAEGEGVHTYPLTFPVAGDHSYVDTFGAPRSGGRTHHGTDIFADKLTPVVAVADGTVIKVAIGRLAGRYIVIRHTDGWRSYYLHLNNDSPGTDDGIGASPVPGIVEGAVVEAGDLLDYVGDSGNAEETPPHLHFELHDPVNEVYNPYRHLAAAEGRVVEASELAIESSPAAVAEYQTLNTELVGHVDPGGGFASGVTVHHDVAYLGTWGRPTTCPGYGVRLIDVADPTQPLLLGAIASADEFPGTSTDAVWAGRLQTAHFDGDLAAVAVRLCDNSERGRWRSTFRGLALYDVTDPTAPLLLAAFDSGHKTQGAHELSVAIRPDGRVVLAATVTQSLLHTDGALGDVRILDITDPSLPVEVGDWDVRRDAPSWLTDPVARPATELHAHSALLAGDGMHLWVAHWDAGTVLLDVERPAVPSFVSSTGFAGPDEEGNAHSVAVDPGGTLLIHNEQDLFPTESSRHLKGWGVQHLIDVANPAAPAPLGTFATEHSLPDAEGRVARDGYYSAHNAVLAGDLEYVAWYSDGVRIVDVSDPRAPREVAHFVPPAAFDPQGFWTAPDGSKSFPMVWGVEAHDGLIYVSDMHTGLWIIRHVPPEPDIATPPAS